jgi:hypothetical protein
METIDYSFLLWMIGLFLCSLLQILVGYNLGIICALFFLIAYEQEIIESIRQNVNVGGLKQESKALKK